MNKTISPKTIVLTFGVLTVSFLAVFYVVAWTEPSQIPPQGNVPAPLNVSATAQTKAGNLTINGILRTLSDMIINTVTIKGDGAISTNLNSDKLDDYEAADLLAGSGGGCAGGLCSEPPIGYYIGYDWDGDTKTAMSGDCDEKCKNCFAGSAGRTAVPDGRDQDCDNTIDEPVTAQKKQYCCDPPAGSPPLTDDTECRTNLVSPSATEDACDRWCVSQGLTSGTVGGYNGIHYGWASWAGYYTDFSDCNSKSAGLIGAGWYALRGLTCYCEPVTGYQ